jgi:hypothetical protein
MHIKAFYWLMPTPIGRGEYYRSSTLIIIYLDIFTTSLQCMRSYTMDSTARDGSSSTELNGPNSGVVGNGLSMVWLIQERGARKTKDGNLRTEVGCASVAPDVV